MLKKASIVLVIVLVIIQFFRVDQSHAVNDESEGIVASLNPPDEVVQILKTSCFDCHSNETKYPWYSQVAPVSWWLKHHIDEAREELNFSQWASFSNKRKLKKLKEIVEELEEGEMPLTSYVLIHQEASLSEEQKQVLLDWANYQKTNLERK